MKVVLELQDQPSNVRRVTVRHDIVIGRGSDCNLRLSSPQVSRRHCFLRVGRDGVSVSDLDSSNGTYVDGKRIKSGGRQDLSNGSVLSLGPIRFVVHVRDEAVVADVLKASVQKDNVAANSAKANGDPSTIISSAAALVAIPKAESSQGMSLDVGQAGESSSAHDATADFVKNDDRPVRPLHSQPQPPEQMDSRAEIVTLGKLITESEHQTEASNEIAGDRVDSVGDEPRSSDVEDVFDEASFFNYDDAADSPAASLVEDPVDADEIVDVVDAEIESVEVVEDVEEVFDLSEDVEVVEEVVEVLDAEDVAVVDELAEVVDVEELVEEELLEVNDLVEIDDAAVVEAVEEVIDVDEFNAVEGVAEVAEVEELVEIEEVAEVLDEVDSGVADAEVADWLEGPETGMADFASEHSPAIDLVEPDDLTDAAVEVANANELPPPLPVVLDVNTVAELDGELVDSGSSFSEIAVDDVLEDESASGDESEVGMPNAGRDATFFSAEMLQAPMLEGPGFSSVQAVEHFDGVFDDINLLDERPSFAAFEAAVESPSSSGTVVDSGGLSEASFVPEVVHSASSEDHTEDEASAISEADQGPGNFGWMEEAEVVASEPSDNFNAEVAADIEQPHASEEVELLEDDVVEADVLAVVEAIEVAEEFDEAEEVIDASELLEADEISEVEEVETLDAVDVVAESEEDSELGWFDSDSGSPSGDDDDIDPELQKFLKGF